MFQNIDFALIFVYGNINVQMMLGSYATELANARLWNFIRKL